MKFILIAIIVCAHAAIIQITDNSYDNFTELAEYRMILFYAPWCEFSKQWLPEYLKISEMIDQVIFGEVDVTKNPQIGTKFDIKTQPIAFFFINEEQRLYNGKRKAIEMYHWIMRIIGQKTTYLNTISQLEHAQRTYSIFTLLTYLNDNITQKELNIYSRVASTFINSNNNKIQFFISNSSEILNILNVTNTTIFLYTEEKYNRRHVNDSVRFSIVNNFIEKYMLPTILSFDDIGLNTLFDNENDGLILFKDFSEESINAEKEFVQYCQNRFKKSLRCFISYQNDSTQTFNQISQIFDPINDEFFFYPQLIMATQLTQQSALKFRFNQNFTQNNIKQFVKNVYNGTIDPFFKSQDLSQVVKQDNVKQIVSKVFSSEISESTQDVLLFLFDTYCKLCEQADKAFSSFASTHLDLNITFLKMDYQFNEIPYGKVQSVPVYILYKANDKSHPIQFQGDSYSVEAINKFLKDMLKEDPRFSDDL